MQISTLFLLGSAPALSVAELQRVFSPQVTLVAAAIAASDQALSLDEADVLQQRLGGTVKIVRVVKSLSPSLTAKEIEQAVADFLDEEEQGKIEFAVGEWERDHLEPLNPVAIKDLLQDKGRTARFRECPRSGCSSALLAHRSLSEVIVFGYEGELLIGNTLTVTNPDVWAHRDRAKPYADRKKGLLPPKVGRMMVNIALGSQTAAAKPATNLKKVLYDPFCGSGTILMEARTLGLPTIGSDLDPAAITGTRQNLTWQDGVEPGLPPSTLMVSDVTRIQLNTKVSYIVTEPFLGKQTPTPSQLPNIFRGLEKLYWGAFRRWKSLLEPGAEVVIVLPATSQPAFSLDNLIDKTHSLGYTTISGPLSYSRPDAVIERQVYHLRFQPEK